MKLFDLSLKLNKFPIGETKSLLADLQRLTDSDFEKYQRLQRERIVDYHLKNNPFYRSIYKSDQILTWEQIPIMTKRNLQQPLDKRISDSFSKKELYINSTSGSSGDPFIFAKDKFCHAMTWSIIQERFGWFNIDFNHSRQARFYGIPRQKIGHYKERLKDILTNRYRFSIYDLSDASFETYLKKFSNYPFDYINGYTSAIVQFAKFLERKNIKLNTICPSLKVCIVTAEMLFDDDKILLEKQFGVPIVNEYGASELDLIAFQNPTDQWIINSESLYVEIVDNDGKTLPFGEEGRIIITSLYNKAHPFIRYELGDIGKLSKDSTLRKPILEKLIGRTNDMAILPSGKKAAGLTFYYITKSIIEDDGNVKEFIIVQSNLNTFKIKYVSTEALTTKQKENITLEMSNYLEDGLNIEFERCEELQRSPSGKLKQFSSEVKQ